MALGPDYELFDGVPSVEEYCELRPASGLSIRTREAAAKGLPGTWAGALVRTADGTAIAMGRVIGDGGCFFEIVDMAVLPEHQGRGIGGAILTRLLERVRAEAPDGAWVSLLASAAGRELYARHGFAPTAPADIGMGFALGDGWPRFRNRDGDG